MSELVTEIFPAFEEFLQPARYKCAYGGRGSAKTRTVVSILINNVLCFGWRVVALREIMESIQDSVYQEFVAEIDRRDLGRYFKILKTHIECPKSGGTIKFSGIKSNQKKLDSQKLKGFSDFDCAWLEEADAVSKESWDALIPTLRKDGSEIWVTFNPKSILDDTYKRFISERIYPDYKDGKRYAVVKRINYTDNPRFPKELRDDMELMKETDFDAYRHIYLGEPVSNDSMAVIKSSWISAAIDAHLTLGIEPTGRIEGGFDVADDGHDKNAVIWRQGIVALGAEEWRDLDPVAATNHAHQICQDNKIEYIKYDNIGVGAGAKGEFRRLQQALLDNHVKGFIRLQTEGFNAGAAVMYPDREYALGKTNKDMFYNIKAQVWWALADRFRNTYNAINGKQYDPQKLISLSKDIQGLDKLSAELCQPKREYRDGKVKVESKADMKKRGVASPNMADALVMCYFDQSTDFSVWT